MLQFLRGKKKPSDNNQMLSQANINNADDSSTGNESARQEYSSLGEGYTDEEHEGSGAIGSRKNTNNLAKKSKRHYSLSDQDADSDSTSEDDVAFGQNTVVKSRKKKKSRVRANSLPLPVKDSAFQSEEQERLFSKRASDNTDFEDNSYRDSSSEGSSVEANVLAAGAGGTEDGDDSGDDSNDAPGSNVITLGRKKKTKKETKYSYWILFLLNLAYEAQPWQARIANGFLPGAALGTLIGSVVPVIGPILGAIILGGSLGLFVWSYPLIAKLLALIIFKGKIPADAKTEALNHIEYQPRKSWWKPSATPFFSFDVRFFFGCMSGSLVGAAIGTLIAPGVGTVIGGLAGASTVALVAVFHEHWLVKAIFFSEEGPKAHGEGKFDDNDAPWYARVFVGASMGFLLGTLLGTVVPGIGNVVGGAVGTLIGAGLVMVSPAVKEMIYSTFGIKFNAQNQEKWWQKSFFRQDWYVRAFVGVSLGAMVGGIVGSIVPGLGTAVGAAVGAAVAGGLAVATPYIWLGVEYLFPNFCEKVHKATNNPINSEMSWYIRALVGFHAGVAAGTAIGMYVPIVGPVIGSLVGGVVVAVAASFPLESSLDWVNKTCIVKNNDPNDAKPEFKLPWYMNMLLGSMVGAGIGGLVGSIVPGIGTAVGATVGAAIGAGAGVALPWAWDKLSSCFTGEEAKKGEEKANRGSDRGRGGPGVGYTYVPRDTRVLRDTRQYDGSESFQQGKRDPRKIPTGETNLAPDGKRSLGSGFSGTT